MTRIVIFEDEEPALALLRAAVQRYDPSIEIVGAYDSVRGAVRGLSAHDEPDLILADIQLSDGLSLEVFSRLPLSCPVIFCTAHDEYVLEALSTNGIDYLLKPIELDRLNRALDKYLKLRRHFAGRLDDLAHALRSSRDGHRRERILVKRGLDYVSIPVADVAYFTTEYKLVILVDRRGEQYVLEQSLADLAEELDASRFFRLNRKFLANYDAVVRFRRYFKGRLLVTLEPAPAEDVVVSQVNARRFRDWMDR